MKHVINELRSMLVAEELVRAPGESGSLPIAWLAPADGTPAPGEGTPASDVVVGIYPAPGIVRGSFEQRWLVQEAVDIYIRTEANAQPEAMELARSIRRLIADRTGFDMGELRVQQCLETRPVQLVSAESGQGATYVISFGFLLLEQDQG